MLFASISFIFYFLPLVLAVYYALNKRRTAQNIVLLLAGILFYAWREPVFVFVLLGMVLFNTAAGLLVYRYRKHGKKAIFLACGISLSLLFVCKYLDLVIKSANMLVREERYSLIGFPIPIGLSFMILRSLSYLIDIHRGKAVPQKNPLNVGLYMAFFPVLAAGPIVPYHSFFRQMENRTHSARRCAVGICRFTLGLGKQMLLAEPLSWMADAVFNWSAIGRTSFDVPVILAWVGLLAFSLQIYLDFSAYSDMAIGLALMFGFKLEENFDYPYSMCSVTDFWRRWHISLSRWFQEYVYFPLGGSRTANKDKMVRNLLTVWLLTGLLHGADWKFVLWGIWNFLFVLAERLFRQRLSESRRILNRFYTLAVIGIGWVLFRAQDMYQAGCYLANLIGINYNGFYSGLAVMLLKENVLVLLLSVLCCTPAAPALNSLLFHEQAGRTGFVPEVLYPVVFTGMLLLSVAGLISAPTAPFFYFRF